MKPNVKVALIGLASGLMMIVVAIGMQRGFAAGLAAAGICTSFVFIIYLIVSTVASDEGDKSDEP